MHSAFGESKIKNIVFAIIVRAVALSKFYLLALSELQLMLVWTSIYMWFAQVKNWNHYYIPFSLFD